jgi:hypothetical protein
VDAFEALTVQLLEQKHSVRFRASGSSMRPFILDGDSVEIQPVDPRTLKRSDIILCRLDSGRMLVHRVVQARSAQLLTQGDALLAPDGWVGFEGVLGKAATLYRRNHRINLNAPWWVGLGWLWLGLAPLRIIVQPGLQILWRKYHGRKAS